MATAAKATYAAGGGGGRGWERRARPLLRHFRRKGFHRATSQDTMSQMQRRARFDSAPEGRGSFRNEGMDIRQGHVNAKSRMARISLRRSPICVMLQWGLIQEFRPMTHRFLDMVLRFTLTLDLHGRIIKLVAALYLGHIHLHRLTLSISVVKAHKLFYECS
jgi:hypothetical protein